MEIELEGNLDFKAITERLTDKMDCGDPRAPITVPRIPKHEAMNILFSLTIATKDPDLRAFFKGLYDSLAQY